MERAKCDCKLQSMRYEVREPGANWNCEIRIGSANRGVRIVIEHVSTMDRACAKCVSRNVICESQNPKGESCLANNECCKIECAKCECKMRDAKCECQVQERSENAKCK